MDGVVEASWALSGPAGLTTTLAGHVVSLLSLYGGLGLLVGLYVVTWGASRLGGAAASGSWGFRVVIFPGLVAFWPWVLVRCWRGAMAAGEQP